MLRLKLNHVSKRGAWNLQRGVIVNYTMQCGKYKGKTDIKISTHKKRGKCIHLNIILDETGNLRMKGRKESDHNTLTMKTKCQTRKALEKRRIWRTNNEESWEDFNEEMQNTPEDANKFEKFLNKSMAQQLGKLPLYQGRKGK